MGMGPGMNGMNPMGMPMGMMGGMGNMGNMGNMGMGMMNPGMQGMNHQFSGHLDLLLEALYTIYSHSKTRRTILAQPSGEHVYLLSACGAPLGSDAMSSPTLAETNCSAVSIPTMAADERTQSNSAQRTAPKHSSWYIP